MAKKKIKKKKKSTKGKTVIKKSTKKTTTAKKKSTSIGGEIGRWYGHKFIVSSKLIRGFDGLQIKGSCELKDKKKSKQGYASRKGGNPTEISLTVHLSALTGCSVRSEAMKLVSQARAGKSDYFYVAKKKLVTYKLMLTSASVKEVEISHKGTWVNADVALTMKQCSKGSSSSSSKSKTGSGSKKASVKKSSPTTSKTSGRSTSKKRTTTIKTTPLHQKSSKTKTRVNVGGGRKSASSVSSATTKINRITGGAKKYTAASKKKCWVNVGGGRRSTHKVTKKGAPR